MPLLTPGETEVQFLELEVLFATLYFCWRRWLSCDCCAKKQISPLVVAPSKKIDVAGFEPATFLVVKDCNETEPCDYPRGAVTTKSLLL